MTALSGRVACLDLCAGVANISQNALVSAYIIVWLKRKSTIKTLWASPRLPACLSWSGVRLLCLDHLCPLEATAATVLRLRISVLKPRSQPVPILQRDVRTTIPLAYNFHQNLLRLPHVIWAQQFRHLFSTKLFHLNGTVRVNAAEAAVITAALAIVSAAHHQSSPTRAWTRFFSSQTDVWAVCCWLSPPPASPLPWTQPFQAADDFKMFYP